MVDRRVFLIVLDSYGIGELPDAATFGDAGCNTLRSIVASKEYDTPLMNQMGLCNINGVDYIYEPVYRYGFKDTIKPNLIWNNKNDFNRWLFDVF